MNDVLSVLSLLFEALDKKLSNILLHTMNS